ncbi:helical backbone metal receptor [Amycolatopsis pittospori]|uniref:helical backbone metal receptor n=1 Tax=Amycolatopsis pittospori TaxID=2749434 RepID=UPI0015F02B61|nr:helical backbone metal receptor [Amycolatopsis pittospori]
MAFPVRLATASVVMALVAGCATGTSDQGAPAAAAPGAIESCGKRSAFAAAPQRVVALDQSSTETLLALGAGGKLAGTANLKTKVSPEYAAEYAKIPVLSPKVLTAEPLRAANPDFVTASFKELFTADRAGTRDELEALGVPTYVSAVNCPDGATEAFERLFRDYENLGKVLGVADRASELAKMQRAVLAEARQAAAKRPQGLKVAWVYSVFKDVPYVAGRTGMPSEMSRISGVTNVFDDIDQEWPEVSWEAIAGRAPDVIVIGDLSERGNPGDTADEKLAMMRAHPVLGQLPAVRDGKIIKLPGIELDASVRTVNALRAFGSGLAALGHG